MVEITWDDPFLAVKSDDRRTFNYRLLQSWYRQEVLRAKPGTYTPRGGSERPLGSLIHHDDLQDRPDLNFLNLEAYDHAIERIDKVHEAGGTLEPTRLKQNMLSSMPVCFNLFGALRREPGFLELIRSTLDPEATSIVRVDCEWAPPPAEALSDKTAFDAVVVVSRSDGSTHLIGIETKYTEPFSTTEYPVDRYRIPHDSSGWFLTNTADGLTAASTNQLWRNALLATTCENNDHANTSAVAVVALSNDRKATAAVAGLRAAMHEPERRCLSVSFQKFVDAARQIGGALTSWADQFERRYLDLSPVADIESSVYAQLHRSPAT